MKPLVVGHRGASAYALENTPSSFRLAVDLGADMVELDVRESLDGEFIVIHDQDLSRISGRRNIVHETHSRILRSIELYNMEFLLFLDEAFDLLPIEVGVLVELKSIRSCRKLADLVKARTKGRNLILASFDLSLLKRVQDYASHLQFGIVSRTLAGMAKARHIGIAFTNVCLDFQAIDVSAVKAIKLKESRVFAWTVDRLADIQRIARMEVDGIISNRPDAVRAVLDETHGARKC